MDRIGENSRRKGNLKRCVLSGMLKEILTSYGCLVGRSWSNDRKGPFTQRCLDIWDRQN